MIWLETHFIWFVLYSVAGWIWEVIVCSVPTKKFINRGFLNGPYCPIYGIGALVIILLLADIKNTVLLFLVASVLSCALEYITSWAMEKIFHARWWDYSTDFMNINGRICLKGAVAFGALGIVLIKFIHPAVASFTMRLPELPISVIALVFFAFLLTDIVYTVTRLSDFEANLEQLTERLNNAIAMANEQRRVMLDKLQDTEFFKKINRQERRIIKAFPKMRHLRYDSAFQKIKSYILGKEDKNN